mgnify:CR=1 FL=1
MDYESKIVTPEQAKTILLRSNYDNRKIRKSVVSKYAKSMRDGDWKMSPEPIAFSKSGRLINGQHRLTAVVESGVPCSFFFAYGFEEDVFDVLDRGAGRSISDALGINRKLAQAATLLAKLKADSTIKSVTDADVRRASELIELGFDEMTSLAKSNAKTFSSAPFQLACVARVMGGANKTETFNLYRDLVLSDTINLPPVGHAAIRMVLSGTINKSGVSGGSKQDYVLRVAWSVFDPQKRHISIIRPRPRGEVFKEILDATGYGDQQ